MNDILSLSRATLSLASRWLENGSELGPNDRFLAQRADISIKQSTNPLLIKFPMSDEEAETLLHEILTRREDIEGFLAEGEPTHLSHGHEDRIEHLAYRRELDALVDDYYGIRDFLGLDD